jgi:hypothetical protein
MMAAADACAQVRMRSLQVRVAAHICGSLSTVVCSSALGVSDAREGTPAADSALPVLAVGQLDGSQSGDSSGTHHINSLNDRGRSVANISMVGFVARCACEDPWIVLSYNE